MPPSADWLRHYRQHPYTINTPVLVLIIGLCVLGTVVVQCVGLATMTASQTGAELRGWLSGHTQMPPVVLVTAVLLAEWARLAWWRVSNFCQETDELPAAAQSLRIAVTLASVVAAIATNYVLVCAMWISIEQTWWAWCIYDPDPVRKLHAACVAPWGVLLAGQWLATVALFALSAALWLMLAQARDLIALAGSKLNKSQYLNIGIDADDSPPAND